jgi:hypothetical protein
MDPLYQGIGLKELEFALIPGPDHCAIIADPRQDIAGWGWQNGGDNLQQL